MNYKKILTLIICMSLITFINQVEAATYKVTITGNAVALRENRSKYSNKIASLSKGAVYTTEDNTLYENISGCEAGWYKINYNSGTGFVCSNYATIGEAGTVQDIYNRPWTTPKAAIVGGAKFISSSYIAEGQFTSYLKKFNVNPETGRVYNHQYMANLRAPYTEAYTSYKSYRDNGLLSLPIEFTIPVFTNMPNYTTLPGTSTDTTCQSEITDEDFENLLNAQNFPESYKCKLRLIHKDYPNWTFIAMHTGLDFNRSVIAEQSVSSIQGGDIYYDLSSGSKIETETGWYIANYDTVAFYLDPRNSLRVERILMFENLGYSQNYTESVVQSILTGTFMAEYSFLDNQSYASIFVEAGQQAQMSAVYLASLARQESGVNGSKATSGAEFTYQGVTYQGLYNFYNIGAYSSAESPILAGLVWASGGATDVIVKNEPVKTIDEATILSKLGMSVNNGCLANFSIGTTVLEIKNILPELTVTISDTLDTDTLKTGQILTISDGKNTFTYTISIKGDVDGDGTIGATDYVKIKNYIMEKSGSELNIAQSLAADADNNASIGATDYVLIKNSIMER